MTKTVTNPQTGERMQLIDGMWKPIPKASAAERVKTTIQQTAREKAVDFDLGTMVSNIPASGRKYASDIATAVINPIDTATGLGKAAIGGVQHLIPGEQSYEPYGSAVADYFGDRYGGMDEFKTTAMEDPVGLLGDTAGMLAGVGMAPKLGKIGQIGAMMDPLNATLGAAGKGVGMLPAKGMYQSAAKMHSRFDADKMTGTALEKGIMPTPGGLDKAQDMVSALSDQVDNLIDQTGRAGAEIPVEAMVRPLQELAMEVSTSVSPNRQAKLATIDKIVKGLQDSTEATGKNTITVAEAQALKRELQGNINWGRKSQTAEPFKLKADKAMAQGVRESLEQAIPEIKSLNLQQKDLLDLMDALEAPASRIGRRDLLGLGTTTKGIMGGMAGDAPGMAAGVVIGMLDAPRIKSALAIQIGK
ncbi:MAG: hypothetical protein KJO69_06295, partial [Gammaproteobacteria bacterium]|nr:hypothetical protein [Gammaproteobacteria bacterium]